MLLDRLGLVKHADLFDLPEVNALITRFLNQAGLKASFDALTLAKQPTDQAYDLVVSNYAFSEVKRPLQEAYFDKVLSKAKRGYLTMNSGKKATVHGEFTAKELLKKLPKAENFKRNAADVAGQLPDRVGSLIIAKSGAIERGG